MLEHDEMLVGRDRNNKNWREQIVNTARSPRKGRCWHTEA